MNSLTKSFKSLSLSKRILLGYADSEGAPYRGDGKSSLWDLCIIFKHVVDGETFKSIEECFHVCHVSLPKYLTRSVVKSKLKHHFACVQHIKEEHSCDDICICFWNAGHDISVLKYYDIMEFKTIDLLKCAKVHTKGKYDSYRLGDLCKRFNVTSDNPIHTSLGDTIRMINVLPYLGITAPDKMSMIINTNSKSKPKPKHVKEEDLSSRRGKSNEEDEIVDDRQQKKTGIRSMSTDATRSTKGRKQHITSAIRRATCHNGTKHKVDKTGK